MYVVDTDNNRIRKVDSAGVITTVAGDGTEGFSGDGGPATSATLRFPRSLAFDRFGNLYIADSSNQRIRRVDSSGVITTVAGNGTQAFSGDGGPASGAALDIPNGVAVDSKGNLFISDTGNQRIRRVNLELIVLSPASASRAVETPHTITASVRDRSGNVVPDGTPVNFNLSGAGATSATVSTTAGNASFTFTSNNAGRTNISASSGSASELYIAYATVDWTSASGRVPRTEYKLYPSPDQPVSCGGVNEVCFLLDNPRSESKVTLRIIDVVASSTVPGTYYIQQSECASGVCTTTEISQGTFCGATNQIVLPPEANRVKVYVGFMTPSLPCGSQSRPGVIGNVRAFFT